MAKKIGKKLKEFKVKTRLKSANEFKRKLLEMFKDYIKSVIIFGALIRGDITGKSDVDVYIIFDDTKFPLGKFNKIRDRIDADILKIAKIDPRLHVQPILALTEFWDGVRKHHPLFLNIIREGYAIYDTGFFIPMRKLLEWGKFPATPEAAELRMEAVPKRIRRVKNVKVYMIAEDLYNAMVDSAQAVLMYMGVGAPAPKVLAREVRKHLIPLGLEEKYVELLEKTYKFRKKVEHKEVKSISGKELDAWIEQTEDYIKRLEKMLKQLEIQRKVADIKKSYEVMIKASVAALKSIKKLPKKPEKLPHAFKKYLIDTGLVSPSYSEVFGRVLEMRKLVEEKKIDKITDRDVYMSKEYVRRFILDVRRVIERPEIFKKELKKKQIKKEAEKAVKMAKETKKTKKKGKK